MSKSLSVFNEGEFYHITHRGIDDRRIFIDEADYFRGIYSLYEFNNAKSVVIRERRKERVKWKESRGQVSGGCDFVEFQREPLVGIQSFVLMSNHIHLLLKQIKNGSISDFMKKLGGYAYYYNQKYKRKGHLFQDRFSARHIEDDEQLKTVFVYIHTNPISLIEPGWKERGIKDTNRAKEFIKNYKWSSYADYVGGRNFPSVTDRSFLSSVMGEAEGCKRFVEDWIEYKHEFTEA